MTEGRMERKRTQRKKEQEELGGRENGKETDVRVVIEAKWEHFTC